MKDANNPGWCVIVNRRTCRGEWRRWQAWLTSEAIPHNIHLTHTLEDLQHIIAASIGGGQRKFLFAGGDGTLHQGCNALLQAAGDTGAGLTIGLLPCGTGNDWVRSFGQPRESLAAALRSGATQPMPVLRITWPDGRVRYAINMLGGALDGAVVAGLKRASLKIPSWILYPYGLLRALMRPHTWTGTVQTDRLTYTGDILTLQAGHGKYCGGGMYVLPHASAGEPGFLIMKPKRLLAILLQTPDIYNGRILRQKEAVYGSFRHMDIDHEEKPIPLEADGEFLGFTPVRVEVLPAALRRI